MKKIPISAPIAVPMTEPMVPTASAVAGSVDRSIRPGPELPYWRDRLSQYHKPPSSNSRMKNVMITRFLRAMAGPLRWIEPTLTDPLHPACTGARAGG